METVAEQILQDQRTRTTQDLFVTFTAGADEQEVYQRILNASNLYGVLQMLRTKGYRQASAEQLNQLRAVGM